MADDRGKRGPEDRRRINLNEVYELRYWTKTLAITEEQLRDAVRYAGCSAAAVKAHLEKQTS